MANPLGDSPVAAPAAPAPAATDATPANPLGDSPVASTISNPLGDKPVATTTGNPLGDKPVAAAPAPDPALAPKLGMMAPIPAEPSPKPKSGGLDDDAVFRDLMNDRRVIAKISPGFYNRFLKNSEEVGEKATAIPEPVQHILDAADKSVKDAPAGSVEEKLAMVGDFLGNVVGQFTTPINVAAMGGNEILSGLAKTLPEARALFQTGKAAINAPFAGMFANETGSKLGEFSVTKDPVALAQAFGAATITALGGFGTAADLLSRPPVTFKPGMTDEMATLAAKYERANAAKLAAAATAEKNMHAADFLKAQAERHQQAAADLEVAIKAKQAAGPEQVQLAGTTKPLAKFNVMGDKERARVLATPSPQPEVGAGAIPSNVQLSPQAAAAAKAAGEPLPGEAPAAPPPSRGNVLARPAEVPATVGKEDPVADRARYEAIQERMSALTKEGKTLGDPEIDALFKENEELKNRNSSSPGMPPEPITLQPSQAGDSITGHVVGEPATAAARPISGMVLASPSTRDIELPRAVRNLQSPKQQRFQNLAGELAPDADVKPAVGVWKDGAENSVATTFHGPVTKAQLDLLSAQLGKAGIQKGVIHFLADDAGPDVLWRVQFPKDVTLEQAHQAMSDSGIEHRTLLPGPDGVTGIVLDQGGANLDNIVKLTDHETKPDITPHPGHVTSIGADTRDAAGKVFDDIIGKAGEGRIQEGNGNHGDGNHVAGPDAGVGQGEKPPAVTREELRGEQPPLLASTRGAVLAPSDFNGGRPRQRGTVEAGDALGLASKKQLPHAVGGEIEVTHYSGNQGLKTVDPKFFGKAHATPIDQQGAPKTYWFVKGSKLGADKGLIDGPGKTRYTARISGNRIYDMNTDPLDVRSEINREKRDLKLQDEGYAGFTVKTQDGRNVVALYEPVKVQTAGSRSVMSSQRGSVLIPGEGTPPPAPKSKQTESPEFKQWFGDSKVVDDKGEPLVVYHGTASSRGKLGEGFSTFDRRLSYFTSNPDYANEFSKVRANDQNMGAGGFVVPTFLSLKNPLDATKFGNDPISAYSLEGFLKGRGVKDTRFLGEPEGDRTSLRFPEELPEYYPFYAWLNRDRPAMKQALQQAGFDGIKMHETDSDANVPGGDIYVAFDPTQIKSATGNRGTFSPTNPDITGSIHAPTMVRIGSTALGAAYGAGTGKTPEDRLKRAAEFGLMGLFLGHTLGRFIENGMPAVDVAKKFDDVMHESKKEVAHLTSATLPNFTRASSDSAQKVVEWASAPNAAKAESAYRRAAVLQDHLKDPIFKTKLMGLIIEDRLQGIKQGLLDAAKAATNKEGGANQAGAVEAARLVHESEQVKSVAGMKGSPFATAADIEAAHKDPEIAAALQRWKDYVQDTAAEQHLATGGKLAQSGPHGLFANLEAGFNDKPFDSELTPAELKAQQKGNVLGGRRMGDVTNTMERNSRFSQQAAGTAERYNFDFDSTANRMVEGNYEEAAKRQMNDQLVKDGLAVVTDTGPDSRPAPTEKYDWVKFPLESRRAGEPARNIWVRSDVAPEYRNAADTNGPIANVGLVRAAKILTKAQLVGIVDPVFHIANIEKALTAAPRGKGMVTDQLAALPGVNVIDSLRRTVTQAVRVLQDSPDVKREIAGLARVGAMRPEHGGIVGFVDKAGRLALNHIFDEMVRRGAVPDTDFARRDFSNQIGQYNNRLMDPLQRVAKESGFAPFIVAGKTFNRLGRNMVTMQPNFQTAGRLEYAKQVARNVVGAAISVAAIPAILNYHNTGKVMGRNGVPVGAIDTGKTDSLGNPIFVDPQVWTGLRRGMRAFGAEALANGLRQDWGADRIGGEMAKQVIDTWSHPWLGPAPKFAYSAYTGKSPTQFQEAKVLNPRAKHLTLSQAGENAKGALLNLQPLVGAYANRRDLGQNYPEAIMHSLGSAVGASSRVPQTPEAGRAEQRVEEQQRHATDLQETSRSEFLKLMATPPAERRAYYDKLVAKDPDMAQQLEREATYQAKNFTREDRALDQLNIKNGNRAKFLMSELQSLPDTEARKDKLRDLLQKKLVNDSVADQLMYLGLGQLLQESPPGRK